MLCASASSCSQMLVVDSLVSDHPDSVRCSTSQNMTGATWNLHAGSVTGFAGCHVLYANQRLHHRCLITVLVLAQSTEWIRYDMV